MSQLVKTVGGLAIANVKTVGGLAIASVKTIGGLDNTSSGPTLVKHEDFASAAAGTHPLSDISGWTDATGHVNTFSPTGYATISGASANDETYWSSGTPSLNQSVEFTYLLAPDTGVSYLGVSCRVQSGGDCYFMLAKDTRTYLEKIVGGTETEIAHVDISWSDGDEGRLVVSGGSGSGTRLKVQKKITGVWTDQIADTDPAGTYLGAGYAGIHSQGTGTNTIAIDEWYWYDI